MPDDIEDFLRRAAQRRAGRRPPVETPARPEAPRPTPQIPSPPRPTPTRSAPQRAAPARPADIEIVDAEPIQDLPAHLAQYLDTSSFQRQAAQLTAEVDAADDKVEAHLHQTFDHAVGDLTGTATPEPDAQRSVTLLDELASPSKIRRAILLSEILRRPEERW